MDDFKEMEMIGKSVKPIISFGGCRKSIKKYIRLNLCIYRQGTSSARAEISDGPHKGGLRRAGPNDFMFVYISMQKDLSISIFFVFIFLFS